MAGTSYDYLGQVNSAKHYRPDGRRVAGQQFEYTFDDIGNRNTTSAGGDNAGQNLRAASYTNNLLNQLTSRSVPGFVRVIGTAASNATVTLWGDNSSYALVARKGDYFRGELSVTNTASAVWLTVTNLAVPQNGTNADTVSSTVGSVFLPQTPETFGYDVDGNMTNNGRWAISCDAENRVTSFTSLANNPAASKKSVACTYDAGWRRTEKVVSTWNGSVYVAQYTNRFVYDGWNLTAILDSQSSVLYSFVWGLDASGTMQGAGGVGGLLSMTVHQGASAGTYFYAYDGNYNVVAYVRAADGQVVAQYEYGPFGEMIRASGPMAKEFNFLFSTKFYDWETGFYYSGYRHYDPSTGRWLSRDRLEELGGVHLYAYVGNNPVNSTDKLGLSVIGRVVVFVARGTTKGFRTIKEVRSVGEAARLVREGEDVVMKSEQLARQVARSAADGATPIKEFDNASQTWHYHPANRCGGHVLYSAVAVVTFSYYAKGQGTATEKAAEVADLVNPLSIGQDILDVYDIVRSMYAPEVPSGQVRTYKGPHGELYVGRNPPPGYKPSP